MEDALCALLFVAQMVRFFYGRGRDEYSRIVVVHKTLIRGDNAGNLQFLPCPWCAARHKKRGCVSFGEGVGSSRQFKELPLDRDRGVENDR